MVRSARLLLASLALAACGSSPAPAGPAQPGPEVRGYAPLAFVVDARAADRAAILGTDRSGGSTVLPLVPGARAVTIEGASHATARGAGAIDLATAPAAGVATTVRASITTVGAAADSTSGTASGAASAGDPAAWRAGAWQAALAAATALDKDPSAIGFTAATRGAPDSVASTGALATGFLASRLGARVDPRAAILAMTCPDGTLAPPADVDALVTAAVARGARRIGVPPGSARRPRLPRGVRLVSIDDLADAYRLATGTVFPAAIPVPAAAMAIDDMPALSRAYGAWQARLAPRWARVIDVDAAGGRPRALEALARAARDAGRTAELLHQRGQTAAAVEYLEDASALALAAVISAEVIDRVAARRLAGARITLDEIDAVARETDDALRGARPAAPTTLPAALDGLAAQQHAIASRAFLARARDGVVAARSVLDRVAQRPRELATRAVADELVLAIAPAALAVGRAAVHARRVTADIPDAGAPYHLDAVELGRRADALDTAASAVLAHVDARRRAAPQTRSAVEPAYLVARAATGAARPAEATALTSLAAAELASFEAWLVVLHRDALGVRRDPASGLVTGVARPDALRALLTAAERAARGHAHAARIATGAIPAQARLAYQVALTRRTGDVADQVAALEQLWRASAWSLRAVALARNGESPPRDAAPARVE